MDIVSNKSRFAPGTPDPDMDLQIDYAGSNIIPSRSEHQISDGQKRYGTLLSDSSSNYPKPKTMFYVVFNYGDTFSSSIKNSELSKFVIGVTKPTITYSTKKMNQYNRIKYVYDNVEYGDLKITFMDVKNSTVEQAFFEYLSQNNNDFNNKHSELNRDGAYDKYAPNNTYEYKHEWGLHNRSNERMFKSITIAEMYFDRLMVYTVENPLLTSINFGENKIGDYSPNEISVTFKVEGITNDIVWERNNVKDEELDIIGKLFTEIGGEDMAHFLGKRWYRGNGVIKNSNKTVNILNNSGVNNYYEQYLESQNKINYAQQKILQQAMLNQGQYYYDDNGVRRYWISDGNAGYDISLPYAASAMVTSVNDLIDLFRF